MRTTSWVSKLIDEDRSGFVAEHGTRDLRPSIRTRQTPLPDTPHEDHAGKRIPLPAGRAFRAYRGRRAASGIHTLGHYGEWLLRLHAERPHMSLSAMREKLSSRNVSVSAFTILAFFESHGIRIKRVSPYATRY
jgi:hypothetical protein